MKKIFLSLMTVLSVALFTSSCSKSDSNGGGTTTPAPTASFTSSVTALVATFTNTSTNIKSSSWNFGDGSAASTATSPAHTYATAGTYTVVLTVTGNDNSTKTSSASVTVAGSGTPAPTASFTSVVTNLQVAFTNTSTNAKSYSWNFGDGSAASTTASPTYTYAAAGTYTVVLTVTGNDNSTKTSTSNVTVTAAAAVAGPNLLVGGNFSDTSKWTRYPIFAGVNVNYSNNSAVWTGGGSAGGSGHYGIWQAVTVTAGKTYQIDMHVKGANIMNVWFEVYVSDTIPDLATLNNTTDYNYGGKRLALNTWDCGSGGIMSAFDAQLSTISCPNDTNKGGVGYFGSAWNKISFPSSMFGGASTGTVYIMIRSGGDNFTLSGGGTGVTVTNVDFHSLN